MKENINNSAVLSQFPVPLNPYCSTSIFEVLRFMPPLTCTENEIDKSLEIVSRCLSEEFKK